MQKKLSKEYAVFERMMDEEEIFLDEDLTFRDVCVKIGADPVELEEIVAAETGYLGDELMEVYRNARNCNFFFLHLKSALWKGVKRKHN